MSLESPVAVGELADLALQTAPQLPAHPVSHIRASVERALNGLSALRKQTCPAKMPSGTRSDSDFHIDVSGHTAFPFYGIPPRAEVHDQGTGAQGEEVRGDVLVCLTWS
jgi:hypothetical protein